MGPTGGSIALGIHVCPSAVNCCYGNLSLSMGECHLLQNEFLKGGPFVILELVGIGSMLNERSLFPVFFLERG